MIWPLHGSFYQHSRAEICPLSNLLQIETKKEAYQGEITKEEKKYLTLLPHILFGEYHSIEKSRTLLAKSEEHCGFGLSYM